MRSTNFLPYRKLDCISIEKILFWMLSLLEEIQDGKIIEGVVLFLVVGTTS